MHVFFFFTHTVFIRIKAPGAKINFEKDQYIICAADNSDIDSAHVQAFDCLMCLTHGLIIQGILVTQSFHTRY